MAASADAGIAPCAPKHQTGLYEVLLNCFFLTSIVSQSLSLQQLASNTRVCGRPELIKTCGKVCQKAEHTLKVYDTNCRFVTTRSQGRPCLARQGMITEDWGLSTLRHAPPAHRELQVLELRHGREVQQALHRQVLDVAQHEPRQRCARGFRVRVLALHYFLGKGCRW